jgi:hypothetical protein
MVASSLKGHNDNPWKIAISSLSDGSGKGKAPPLVAEAANSGFKNYWLNYFIRSKALTPRELVKHTILAVEAAQKQILEGRDNDEPLNANTTHLGLIAVVDDKSDTVHCCFSSIGDCKLLAKFPDGSLQDMTQDVQRPNRDDARDPGGQLGRKYRKREAAEGEVVYGEIPDLRNFTVAYFTVPKGTVFLPMSDGVHDNFDPVMLGLSAREAFDALTEEERRVLPGMQETYNVAWASNSDHLALRQAYFLSKIRALIANKRKETAVVDVVNTAISNAKSGKGKRDDTSCGWIPVV